MRNATRSTGQRLQRLEVQNPVFLALALTALLAGPLGIASPALAGTPVPVGQQFQVSVGGDSPSVSHDAASDFVVVWARDGIRGQRYDATGATVGSEFQVNTYTTASQLFPSVSHDAAGDFVVVWYSNGSAGSD